MRLRIAALTLAIGLGIVGLVSAEESGNWFSRMFTSSSAKVEAEKTSKAKSDLPPMQTSYAKRSRIAKVDLERRQEVCLKLREIALANGDDETLRKVEQLEQRAYELYVATMNARSTPLVEASVKKGDR